tara:strand:+ start:6976 stop:7284 length:309 start_codon:yes stop_codon:yes gene_type:complete
MDLSTVKGIYRVIGKDKLSSLSKQAEVKFPLRRPIAKATLERIGQLIKTNRKITRTFLLKNSGISEGFTQECIKVLHERMLITKEKNYKLPNNPIVYVWAGV